MSRPNNDNNTIFIKTKSFICCNQTLSKVVSKEEIQQIIKGIYSMPIDIGVAEPAPVANKGSDLISDAYVDVSEAYEGGEL